VDLIAKNDNVFNVLAYEKTLLDSNVEKIEIATENMHLKIMIYFNIIRKNAKYHKVCLEFNDVLEYGFYYNSDYIFYNVESFKFFNHDNLFYYLSMDPVDEKNTISDKDQDFVKAKAIRCYEIKT